MWCCTQSHERVKTYVASHVAAWTWPVGGDLPHILVASTLVVACVIKKSIFKCIFFHHRFHWRTLLPWHLGQVTAFRLPILFTLNLCDIVSIWKIFPSRCGFFPLVPNEKHRRGRAICSRLQVMYSGTPTELRNYWNPWFQFHMRYVIFLSSSDRRVAYDQESHVAILVMNIFQ